MLEMSLWEADEDCLGAAPIRPVLPSLQVHERFPKPTGGETSRVEPRNLRPVHYSVVHGIFYSIGKENESMKEKWNEFNESLTENVSMGRKEFLLVMAVCMLAGIVLGMVFAPKRTLQIGSNNGNNNCNNKESKIRNSKELAGLPEDE